jgi:hypothetical protein
MSRVRLIAALILLLGAAGCATPPPPLGADLPSSTTDARVAFDERIKSRFPSGSRESALRDELAREHFTVTEETATPTRWRYVARRDSSQLVCDTRWTISWNSADGTIQDIAGEFSQLCP